MNKKKIIELFIYVVIVVVGIILLITSNTKDNTGFNAMNAEGGNVYAIVSYGG